MAQIILDSNNNLIQGDFDNATLNNRTKLQTTTTNATTNVYVVPNGSSTSAGVSVANNSSLTNASKIVMATNGSTDTQIISGVNGSGTYLPLSFYTNNALAMQVATSGYVGIGTSSPSAKLDVASTNGNLIYLRSTSAYSTTPYTDLAFQYQYESGGTYTGGTAIRFSKENATNNEYGSYMSFYTRANGGSSAEAMRITAAGQTSISNLSAYQTPEGVFTVNGNGCGDYIGAINNRNTSNCNPAHGLIFRAGYNGSASGSNYFSFRRPDNTVTGSITQTGSTTISYNSSSDYRLKEEIKPMTNALERLSLLKPVTYKWKECGSEGEGFIAHELQEVVPLAVSGKKDGVDLEGKPDYQGIDPSKLVSLLTAAIQEQQTIINELKTRIEALESK
jgi:hypothetical protein